ncbi:MAG: hypothetical protein JW751_13905 [Polyangiaceae bacterium]|nr:hypothetical protein [Polyangiaceae bacterium]
MSGHWAKSPTRVAGPPRSGASAHLVQPTVVITAVRIADARAGANFAILFQESDDQPPPLPIPPAPAGSAFQGWGQGAAISTPEWEGAERFRAAVYRNRPLSVMVRLTTSSPASSAISGALVSSPSLDGDGSLITGVNTPFTIPAGAAETWARVDFGGTMPDEVGRFVLDILWSAVGSGFTFAIQQTKLRIYSLYDTPLLPGYDSALDADDGSVARTMLNTNTGTRKRLDHMMRLVGGRLRRHASATTADVIDIIWNLHVGINNASPPYFDGVHAEHITNNGRDSGGTDYPLEQQWLMWVSPRANPAPLDNHDRYWNDASCIGHVQLLKTMAAAVGLFTRRTWVFPHTRRRPDGTLATFADTDLYALGNYSSAHEQTWTFPRVSPTGRDATIQGRVVLMEPGATWENFEACCRSPNGRFLPGGYSTSSINSPGFMANKGFASARDLIRWWANTRRPGFGKRFQCWVGTEWVANPSAPPAWVEEWRYWDVDGNPWASPGVPYNDANYTLIRDRGKELPPP